jgi:pyruvate formate lyase activating enzyme
MLRVHSIETFGTHDGPEIRMIVFLQGCNLRCLYCQNPDTQKIGVGKEMQTAEILALLEKERPYFKNGGGLTVSGGEPLMQRQALIEVFTEVKKAGFTTALDTNGSILDDYSKKLLKVTDVVLLDVKHINPKWFAKVTNGNIAGPLAFAAHVEVLQKRTCLRYVLVPGYTDQEKYLHEWGRHFKDYKTFERVEILPFHQFGFYKYEQMSIKNPLAHVKPPTKEQIQKAYKIFLKYFPNVYVR